MPNCVQVSHSVSLKPRVVEKAIKKFLIEKQRPENDYFFRFESWAQDVSKTKVLTVQTLLREGIYLQKNNFRLG